MVSILLPLMSISKMRISYKMSTELVPFTLLARSFMYFKWRVFWGEKPMKMTNFIDLCILLEIPHISKESIYLRLFIFVDERNGIMVEGFAHGFYYLIKFYRLSNKPLHEEWKRFNKKYAIPKSWVPRQNVPINFL